MNFLKTIKFFILSIAMVAIFGFLTTNQASAAVPYAVGDVFTGVGNGKINQYTPTGVLIQQLNTTSGSSEQTGMCFDSSSNLYSTNWTAGSMSKFDGTGVLLTHPWGGPFSVHPESCVLDAANNIYTGEVDGANQIHKWDTAGNLLASYSPASGPRGVDWIDLAADQCTIFYTSEGGVVKRFNVCTNTQDADFASGLPSPCFALRIRANGEVLVTCSTQTVRLDATGVVMQTYPIPGESLFAMNLDPDGLHFWTGGYSSRKVYKVDIATGVGTGAPVFTAAAEGPTLAGLAIFGEPTVAKPEITLDPATATNEVGTDHTVTATVKAGGNPIVGEVVTFTVVSGPNTGATGTCSADPGCKTDVNGQVSFTYTGGSTAGTDEIEACVSDQGGNKQCALAKKEWIVPTITLTPETAQNPVGTEHTVKARVMLGNNPESGVLVTFTVVSGPNTGATGTCMIDVSCKTDSNGEVSFTYMSNGFPGTDTIEACFNDKSGTKHCERVTKEWTSLPGRMTGGGSIGLTTAKHGFELHCTVSDMPNRLEVNWSEGNKFHLETLTAAGCSDDPSIIPNPPSAGFDTYFGQGTGRYNGVSGYSAKWKFTDAGEPGVNDHVMISIYDPSNVLVDTFDGALTKGNHQAHKE